MKNQASVPRFMRTAICMWATLPKTKNTAKGPSFGIVSVKMNNKQKSSSIMENGGEDSQMVLENTTS